MRRVIYLPQAEQDLTDLWDHIAKDSAFYADRYVKRLMDRVDRLAKLSRPGRVRDDVFSAHVRGYTERSHLILFEATEERLTVFRIVHGSRNLPSIRLGDD